VTAGFYGSLAGLQVDSAGVITSGYNAWNATPTYPANQYVLGSNSRLYRAVISNAGNDPTTDGGTNWVRVSIPLLGTSGKLVVSDGNEGVYVAMSGDATLTSAGAITVVKSNSNVFPTAATALGDVWYGSAANTLLALAGNITTTRKFLRQVGNGSVSAAPAWDTIATGDLPALAGDVSGAPGANTVDKVKNVACGATSWAATAGRVPIFDGDSLESVALSGDVTVSGSGVTAIGAAKVTLAMLEKAPLISVDLYGGLTPSAAAADTYEWTVPYGPGGETYTFTTTRVTIRTNDDPTSGSYTFNVQKSTAAGAFSSAGNLLSSSITLSNTEYEEASTSTGSSTFQSGNKLRVSWSAVGVGIGATSIVVEAKRTA
jgi:hypothetical protein